MRRVKRLLALAILLPPVALFSVLALLFILGLQKLHEWLDAPSGTEAEE